MTQKEAIIKYLDDFGSISSMEAFADLGITRLAARISDLKKDGLRFNVSTIKSVSRYGKAVYFARYSLTEG